MTQATAAPPPITPTPAAPKLSSDQFAEQIKAKYPAYANVDNTTLTQKMLAKYPQYVGRVDLAPAPPAVSPFGGVPAAPGGQSSFAPANLAKIPGQIKSATVTPVVDAAKSGVDQASDAIVESEAGKNPIETGAKFGAGVVNTLFAPLAPVFAPVSKAISKVASKVSDIPAVQKFANSKPGAATARGAELVSNLDTIAGAVAGKDSPEPIASKVADLSKTDAANPLIQATKAPIVPEAKPNVLPSAAKAIVDKRVTELQKLEDNNGPVRKVITKAKDRGIDVKGLLAQTDLLHGAVDDTGTLRTQNAMAELNSFIKPHEDVISANLDKEGVKLPMTTVEKSLRASVNNSGLEGDALEAAHTKVDATMKGLGRRADTDGNIPLAKIQDAKTSKYATIDYLNPASKIADKAIARSFKTLVEKHTKSVDVEALNKELANHYAVMNLLEKLDGKKVEGGKLGKYFAQTLGGIVGSHFGPLGGIAGAEIAGRIKGANMASKFNGKTGAVLKPSDLLAKATAKGKAPQLLLPAAKPGALKVQIFTPTSLASKVQDEAPAQIIRQHSTGPKIPAKPKQLFLPPGKKGTINGPTILLPARPSIEAQAREIGPGYSNRVGSRK